MTQVDGHEVALVHDYLTQRGGAERVVLSMLRAFPDAPLYTSVYEPECTFPEFRSVDVRPMERLNAVGVLRRHHRLGLPVYGPAFRRLRVEAKVVLCSSSGWAHHVDAVGRKIVYCHTPARWLYQSDAYMRDRGRAHRVALDLLTPGLARRDRAAAATAELYLANSNVVRQRIADIYGLEAEVLSPPPGLDVDGDVVPVDIEPGFILVVSRLLAYKNVDAVIAAVSSSGRRLVVVGDGPELPHLRRIAGTHVTFLNRIEDAQLRWLYLHCHGLVAAAYEDFGLVALEANAFGAPVAALRWGGFLDTVVDGETGVLFSEPEPDRIVAALERLEKADWDRPRIQKHAARHSEALFVDRLRSMVSGRSTDMKADT